VAYKDVGVGVCVGWSGLIRRHWSATELLFSRNWEEKSLPEGKAVSPVAGYLFFLRPRGKVKIAAIELTYYDGASPTVAPIFSSGP
jgi:hypothetical protein